MSTAIALQDMHQTQENGAIRHRSVTKGGARGSVTPHEDDWTSSPQDAATLALPLDSQPFTPTKTYWISPHSLLSTEIKILDLTKDMNVPFTSLSNEYKEEVKKTLKDHSFTPPFTVTRDTWLGHRYTIKDPQDNILAQWKHPWTSMGEATLTFPANSPHSSHPIILKNKRWGLRTEAFTFNSMLYVWEMDSLWHSRNMTLYRVYGSGEHERKTEIGKCAQKWWGGFVTGGTFVLDEKELDGLVACLTLCVVLKKKRQRAAERNGGGGGAGGGS